MTHSAFNTLLFQRARQNKIVHHFMASLRGSGPVTPRPPPPPTTNGTWYLTRNNGVGKRAVVEEFGSYLDQETMTKLMTPLTVRQRDWHDWNTEVVEVLQQITCYFSRSPWPLSSNLNDSSILSGYFTNKIRHFRKASSFIQSSTCIYISDQIRITYLTARKRFGKGLAPRSWDRRLKSPSKIWCILVWIKSPDSVLLGHWDSN